MTEQANQDDLRYTPPPEFPVGYLHPSRMTPSRLAGIFAGSVMLARTRRRLLRVMRQLSGRQHCQLFGSGRAALRWALEQQGAGPGVEVVLSTFNCPAVVDAVLVTGAEPMLVDFDPDTGPQLDEVDLTRRIVVLTNGMGLDEWSSWSASIYDRGGQAILDLAQGWPCAELLIRYRDAPCALVLSFGEGKALGGVGGGMVLPPGGAPERSGARELPTTGSGFGGVRRELLSWVLQHAPLPLRAAAGRRRRQSRSWSATKAAHLPVRPNPVPADAPDRWQLAAIAAMLPGASRARSSASRLHRELVSAASELDKFRFVDSVPDLSTGIELVCRARGDRYRLAQLLADRGIPSTWNYYPLHLMRPYRSFARQPLPMAEELWRRVLTLPKQAQPRLNTQLMIDALLLAAAELPTADAPGTNEQIADTSVADAKVFGAQLKNRTMMPGDG